MRTRRWKPIVRDVAPGSPLRVLDWVGPAVAEENGVPWRGKLTVQAHRNRRTSRVAA